MKYTKANVVKVLKALSKNCRDVARIFTEDSEMRIRRTSEACAYDAAISLLTDQKFFNRICEIMKIGDD